MIYRFHYVHKVFFSRFSYICNLDFMEFFREVIRYWGKFEMGFILFLFLVF